jgi:hypothetical protein
MKTKIIISKRNKAKIYILSTFITILLLVGTSSNAQHPDLLRLDSLYKYCSPLIEVEKLYSYGPPSTPNIGMNHSNLNLYNQKLNEGLLDADGLYELAYLNYYFEKYEVAISLFKKSKYLNNFSIRFYPTYLSLHIAKCFENLELFDDAEHYYLLYNDPYYLKLFNARVAKKQENYELAESLYLEAQAIQLFEIMNTEPLKELAIMFKLMGDYNKASFYAVRYHNCLKFENENPESKWGLPSDVLEEAEELVKQIQSLIKN